MIIKNFSNYEFYKKHQSMKNPLFTHISERSYRDFLKKTLSIFIFALSLVTTTLGQTPTSPAKTECECLNNASNATDGQYLDFFTFNSNPGEDWRIMSPIGGFYHPASLPPPATPILYLPNTRIPEVSPGVYRIEGKRVSGQGWTVDILNAGSGQRQTVASLQNCRYPSHSVSSAMPAVSISGSLFVCPNGTGAVYQLLPAPPNTTYSNLSWSLANGGTIISATNTPSITVDWGPTPGTYSMGTSGIAANYAGQPRGCNFSVTQSVNVVESSPFVSIRGDFGNCQGSTKTYSINATATQLQNVVWTLIPINPSGASIPLTQGSINTKEISWPTVGTYTLSVTGRFRINSSTPFCDFSTSQQIIVVNEPQPRALACTNEVNISMNPSCELTFSPDQFLEGAPYPLTSYDVMITDPETGLTIPNGTLGFNYVGKRLQVKVIHECTGNSCWGYAFIEDKAIPELACPDDTTIECTQLDNFLVTGFPTFESWVTVTPSSTLPNTWILTGFDRCSDVTLTYSDEAETDLCTGPYSSIITRTWVATDGSGNTSDCSHIISVLRADIDDVIFPPHWDDVAGPNPSLEACGDWQVLPADHQFAGNPHPDYTGYPFGTLCLKASVSFTDRKLPLCDGNPNTYKLIRRWVVLDHCTSMKREENQLIAVMDTEGPALTCPEDRVINGVSVAAVITTEPYKCSATWAVVPPIAISDCSNVTWDVEFLLADNNGNPPVNGVYTKLDGNVRVVGSRPAFASTVSQTARPYTIQNLPLGRTWLRYTVIDQCGNFTYCFTEVDVADNIPPTPVCDQNSIVAIGNGGEAFAGPLTFDDKSHDNCTLTCMKVRRMDQGAAVFTKANWDALTCNNRVRFTCADVGRTVMVELYVQDAAGHWNTCMVNARVQDNLPPTITAPPAATANCYEDLTSLTRFGAPVPFDNCTLSPGSVIEKVDRNLNDCGLGTITRTFTVTDAGGNSRTATQVITVGNNRRFNGNTDIRWPQDVTLNNVCLANIAPDNLPTGRQRPDPFRNLECSEVLMSYEDVVFNFGEDNVCTKVLRTWTVKDWCQGNAQTNDGVWQRTQLIMINNTSAPTILSGCAPSNLMITQLDECRANVRVTAAANDDCTPDNLLIWSYSISEVQGNNKTPIVTNISGNTVNRDFRFGTYEIVWSVKDQCDNVRTCTNTFTLTDTKKPTPACITELVTVIMPTSGDVAIWASDFDKGSYDNCSTSSQLTASFSATNRMDISRSFTCEDLEGEAFKDFSLDVYIIDAAGNSDFCTVNLRVQDNNNSCGNNFDDDDTQTLTLRGSVYSEQDDMVEGVDIQIMAEMPEYPRNIMTQNDGAFMFDALDKEVDYTLTPNKTDDILNGVSTLDLVMIQRHILGIQELDSPYKIIAADVNNSQRVTAADLGDLRKVILGVNNQFPNNKSWRFVDAQHTFTNNTHPFPYAEEIFMENVKKDYFGLDFIAVKIGDVNATAKMNNLNNRPIEPRSIQTLNINTISAGKGSLVDVKLKADNLDNFVGMQMTLQFDANKVSLENIFSEELTVNNENFGFTQLSEGKINISWNNSTPVKVKDNILTLTFKVLEEIHNDPIIDIAPDGVTPEIYSLEGDIRVQNVRVKSDTKSISNSGKFEVYQNIPNPFNTLTTIGFNLPEASNVSLKVVDATGKLVYHTQSNFGKGYNAFELDAQSLNLSGVLYYQIDTEKHSETRKMIIIK